MRSFSLVTFVTATLLPTLIAAQSNVTAPVVVKFHCNHALNACAGDLPGDDGGCGSDSVHVSSIDHVCGGYAAMCRMDADCSSDYWCCGGHCVGTCNSNGTNVSPTPNMGNMTKPYNSNPVQIYTGAAGRTSVGFAVAGVAVGVAAALL